MDDFKAKLACNCGPGGMRCAFGRACCNSYHGKKKAKLNRLARRQLKQENARRIAQDTNNVQSEKCAQLS